MKRVKKNQIDSIKQGHRSGIGSRRARFINPLQNPLPPRRDFYDLRNLNKVLHQQITAQLSQLRDYRKNANWYLYAGFGVGFLVFVLDMFLGLSAMVFGPNPTGKEMLLIYLLPGAVVGSIIYYRRQNLVQKELETINPHLCRAIGYQLCKIDRRALGASRGVYGTRTLLDPYETIKNEWYYLHLGTAERVSLLKRGGYESSFGFGVIILELPPLAHEEETLILAPRALSNDVVFDWFMAGDAPTDDPFFREFDGSRGDPKQLVAETPPEVRKLLSALRADYPGLALVFHEDATLICWEQESSEIRFLCEKLEAKTKFVDQIIPIIEKSEDILMRLGLVDTDAFKGRAAVQPSTVWPKPASSKSIERFTG